MNREECESKILEKLKEVRAIVKEYDKSNDRQLAICIMDDYINCSNRYWETNTPIDFFKFGESEAVHVDD